MFFSAAPANFFSRRLLCLLRRQTGEQVGLQILLHIHRLPTRAADEYAKKQVKKLTGEVREVNRPIFSANFIDGKK